MARKARRRYDDRARAERLTAPAAGVKARLGGLAPPKRGFAKASRSRSRHASLAQRVAGVAGWRGEGPPMGRRGMGRWRRINRI